MRPLTLAQGDALIVTDIQNDFLPGGTLAVPDADQVILPLNQAVQAFASQGLPVFATRDWHPENHCSFYQQGGPWPPHCVAGTFGAEFSSVLLLPSDVELVSKATQPDQEAYSSFRGTDLDERLRARGVTRIIIGGLTTEYCVLNTVRDAVQRGYKVVVLMDTVRAVDVHPEDGSTALAEMQKLGATLITSRMLSGTQRLARAS